MAAPRKVIIDTDPGVDDALALLFAMCSPELKIEAITVVAGNVQLELALLNALRMVQIAGRRWRGDTRRRSTVAGENTVFALNVRISLP